MMQVLKIVLLLLALAGMCGTAVGAWLSMNQLRDDQKGKKQPDTSSQQQASARNRRILTLSLVAFIGCATVYCLLNTLGVF